MKRWSIFQLVTLVLLIPIFAFGVTKTLVDTDSAQTVTNKTITVPDVLTIGTPGTFPASTPQLRISGDDSSAFTDVGIIGFRHSSSSPTTDAARIVFNRGADGNAGVLDFYTQAAAASLTRRLRIDASGAILSGTTVNTNVGASELAFANAKYIRGVNAAGTDTIKIIGLNASDKVDIPTTLTRNNTNFTT